MSAIADSVFGPLQPLLGCWQGDLGEDRSPDPDGIEENPYFETLEFTPVGEVTNAEQQTLAVLHYRQIVSRKSDGKVFHDQSGYWHWDAASERVYHTLAITRGVVLVAEGTTWLEGQERHFLLRTQDGSIGQSAFMQQQARTTGFSMQLHLSGDLLSYCETTTVVIYGRTVEHTDRNQLRRCKSS